MTIACLCLLFTTSFTAEFLPGATKDIGWKLLYLRFHSGHLYRASSELSAPANNIFGPYGMHRLFDNNLKTCWAEGVKGPGIGESLYLAVAEGSHFLAVANGYQKSRTLYWVNNRLKTIQITVFIGINLPGEATEQFTVYHARKYPFSKTVSLADTLELQKIYLPFDWKLLKTFKDKALLQFMDEKNISKESFKPDVRYILQIQILDIYKGKKYNDTCISEIRVENPLRSNRKVKKVYLNQTENTIFMDTETATKIILDRDPNAVFQLTAVSPDRQWVIAIKLPAHIGNSRTETTYLLYNTFLGIRIDPKALGPDVGEMYDFERSDGLLYLNYLNNKTMKIDSLNLQPVYEKLTGRK